MELRTKHKRLSLASKALSHLSALFPTLLAPSYLLFLLILGITKFNPVTGPLHCWFLPNLSSPRSAHIQLLFSFKHSFKANFRERLSLTTPSKVAPSTLTLSNILRSQQRAHDLIFLLFICLPCECLPFNPTLKCMLQESKNLVRHTSPSA